MTYSPFHMAFPMPFLLLVALLVAAATWLWDDVFLRLVWRPYAITKGFREQGIHGPSYSFFKGCNEEIRSLKEKTDGLVLDVGDHKYLPRIAPHYLKWRAQYGEPFLYWYGPQARICIFDYELARQILSSKSGHFVKNDAHPTLLALIGKGLVFMEGADWVRHRRVINPVFTIDKLKIMTKTMLDFAQNMASELEAEASRNEKGETEVDMNKQFSDLTVHNIAYVIFGNSYNLLPPSWNIANLTLNGQINRDGYRRMYPSLNFLIRRNLILFYMIEGRNPSFLLKNTDKRKEKIAVGYSYVKYFILFPQCIIFGDTSKTQNALYSRTEGVGKQVFEAQAEMMGITMATFLDVPIPGLKYLPTEANLRKWMLERKLKSLFKQIIQPRLASGEYGNDLLGVMLDSCSEANEGGKQVDGLSLSMEEIIHECKLFFHAGHETTAILLTWSVYLLSIYPEWQERLRKEVLREFGREAPNPNALGKLKEMTMVLFETLRLYSPALFMQRKTQADMTVGSTKLPKGTAIVIPIPIMHRDKKAWGDDADEFNPMRFENGITGAAKVPHGLLAFSMGPRNCIGQDFSMLEAKSTLALMLQKFSFALSPDYVHAPVDLFTLKPKFGLPVILRPLKI